MPQIPTTSIAVGSVWRGQTTSHPWEVRVIKVSRLSIEFECMRGPANSRGVRERLKTEAFQTCYRFLHP